MGSDYCSYYLSPTTYHLLPTTYHLAAARNGARAALLFVFLGLDAMLAPGDALPFVHGRRLYGCALHFQPAWRSKPFARTPCATPTPTSGGSSSVTARGTTRRSTSS